MSETILGVIAGILIVQTVTIAYWLEKIHHVLKILEEAQRKERQK